MDILRKELNVIYAAQCLDNAALPAFDVETVKTAAESLVQVKNGCAVITDASCVNNAFALAGRFIAITNPGQRPGLCAFGPSARISPVGRPAPSLYLHILHGTHHKSCGATGCVCETAS